MFIHEPNHYTSTVSTSWPGCRTRSDAMENKRYVNQLHWVFDLPDGVGWVEGNAPMRVMMIFDRSTGVMKVDVLNKGIPVDVRKDISTWLYKNTHICDELNGSDG